MPRRRTRFGAAVLIAIVGSAMLAGSSNAQSADPLYATGTSSGGIELISTAKTLHAVGVTHFQYARGKDRPLPTTVWYPAVGRPRKVTIADGRPATGRYPLIVWSHGFQSFPEQQAAVLEQLASNGFVVVAPLYPGTRKGVKHFNAQRARSVEVPNQALDASYVITQMLQVGNPLASHIDPQRMAAAGHSGGGSTTNALFTKHRDPRLKAGIVVAGRPMGSYNGSAAPILFIHGNKDPVVAYDQGRSAYGQVKWPKAFLTLIGAQHGAALAPQDPGHTQMMATMLDWLRWTLDNDTSARDRLGKDAALPGVTKLETSGLVSSAASKPQD